MSLREEKKQNTKRAILESAISLFNENGYDNTSIEQIARKAGVGKGTVYSYFNTKKSIIKGFCEYELETIHNQLVAQSNPDATVLEQMLIIYMTEFHHVTQNPEFGRLYMREALFPDDTEIENTTELDEKYFDVLFPILKKGQERGELRKDLELLHITAHFYSLFIILIHAWYTKRIKTNDVEASMEMVFKQVLEGLRPLPATQTLGENSND
jgi:AcrR family transcriptional regulator